MPMPPYQIYCYSKDCKQPAQYKIAATWSDGVARELKTFGLCCADCLPKWFQRGRRNFQACKLLPGESVETPGIYLLQRGHHDQGLSRQVDLEKKLLEQCMEPA